MQSCLFIPRTGTRVSTHVDNLQKKYSEVTPEMINTLKKSAAEAAKASELLRDMINKNPELPPSSDEAPLCKWRMSEVEVGIHGWFHVMGLK